MEKKDTDYNQLEEENAIANDILSPPKFYRFVKFNVFMLATCKDCKCIACKSLLSI